MIIRIMGYPIHWSIQAAPDHYSDVTMSIIASQIPSDSTVCLSVCLDEHQRKHQTRVTGLLWGVSTCDRWASYAEIISISWRHYNGLISQELFLLSPYTPYIFPSISIIFYYGELRLWFKEYDAFWSRQLTKLVRMSIGNMRTTVIDSHCMFCTISFSLLL